MGYNQLLSTNTLSFLAEHGDRFVATLSEAAATLKEPDRAAMERKISSLHKMIAYARTVPRAWSHQDKLAKTTRGGIGIHAAVLDRDIGPLLQTQKLLEFRAVRTHERPRAAVDRGRARTDELHRRRQRL